MWEEAIDGATSRRTGTPLAGWAPARGAVAIRNRCSDPGIAGGGQRAGWEGDVAKDGDSASGAGPGAGGDSFHFFMPSHRFFW